MKIFKRIPQNLYEYVYDKYKIERGKVNLISLSRLSPEKNLQTAIKSISHLVNKHPNIQYIIIGDGPEKNKLFSLVKKLKLTKYIRFTGRPENKDIPFLINIGSIFVHPSLIELEGMVVLEAMACGLPLIISDSETSAAGDLVKNNGYTFNSKDPYDLATKVDLILSDNDIQTRYSQNSLKNAKLYDIKLSIRKLESIFIDA